MKDKISNRAPGVKASIAGVMLLLLAGFLGAAIEPPGLEDLNGSSGSAEWRDLIDTHGETDWVAVARYLERHPDDPVNAEIMAIPLALGSSYLVKYEADGNTADLAKAISLFEWIADRSELWEDQPSGDEVIGSLVLAVNRVQGECDYMPLPSVPHKRVAALWKRVVQLLQRQADVRLVLNRDEVPFFSCFAGKYKAEENASRAALFATAANFLRDDPRAPAWEEMARLLAYDTIVRPSDSPDKTGRKICTVGEDLTLWSEEATPDPQDTSRILVLLSRGALTYRTIDREIPEEFTHNVRQLVRKYTSYLTGDISWISGGKRNDEEVLPFPLDPALQKAAPKQRVIPGLLPESTSSVLSGAADLRVAIQDSKAALNDIVTDDFWKFPSQSPCYEIRFKEPKERPVE